MTRGLGRRSRCPVETRSPTTIGIGADREQLSLQSDTALAARRHVGTCGRATRATGACLEDGFEQRLSPMPVYFTV